MPRPPDPEPGPGHHPDHRGRHRPGRLLGEDLEPWPEDDLLGMDEADVPGASDDEEPYIPGDAEQPSPVPVLSVPASLRSVDVAVGSRAVRGLVLVALVVLAVLGGRFWWVQQGAGAVPVERVAPADGVDGRMGAADDGAQAGADPEEVSGGAPGVQGTAPAVGPASTSPVGGASGTPPGTPVVRVVVHVIGEVRRPGVVELPAGARVADAVDASGGFTEQADHASLNLARALVDGEQVWVGAPGEEPPPDLMMAGTGAQPPAAAGGAAGGPSAPAASAPAPLDLNHATQADLEELPGIGPVTAGRILAWREQHGRFSTIEELMEVSGIGERTFAQLEPLVVVGG